MGTLGDDYYKEDDSLKCISGHISICFAIAFFFEEIVI